MECKIFIRWIHKLNLTKIPQEREKVYFGFIARTEQSKQLDWIHSVCDFFQHFCWNCLNVNTWTVFQDISSSSYKSYNIYTYTQYILSYHNNLKQEKECTFETLAKLKIKLS